MERIVSYLASNIRLWLKSEARRVTQVDPEGFFCLTISFMTKTRIAVLVTTFLFAFNFQPGWVADNFWYKADFYKSIPFEVPYMIYQMIYAVITTLVVECVIRFIKRFT